MSLSLHIAGRERRARRPSRLACAAGLAVGLAAVAIGLRAWTIRSTGPVLGTDIAVSAVAPGELALSGSGLVMQASGMRLGGRVATGALRMRNITGSALRVRIRALGSTRELDDALALSATSGGRRVAAGPARGLRTWSAGSIRIGMRETATVALRGWLRRPLEGLIADVTLELRAWPVPG